ncbi:similar to MFS transporter [Paecilomyces variotii No. 5]|uniref:Similar to MFS transporter n=1 Tax=Byssochlamys spectabilis (strain No. 5 / NBRC 109023) TaxID=1356009 RepID=V5FZ75_BYSSN|nr:similar to MFS transporter [Paecilomyces variotii No. 5]
MQSSGIQMGQIISGFVFEKLGTPAVFGLTAIIYGLLALAAYFVCSETTYIRPDVRPKGPSDEFDDKVTANTQPKTQRPYREQLALFNGKLTTHPFSKGLIKPITLLAFPTVIYPTILFSTYFCLLVSMSVLAATVFAAAPYNLSSAQVGLTNLSVLFASLVGSPLAGWIVDYAVKIMSRKNRVAPGRFEAEFRLILVGIAMPLAAIGLFGFGFSVRNSLALPYPLMFMAFFTMAFVFVSQSVLAYMIDVHTEDVSQAYTAMNIVTAVVVFTASSYVNGWDVSAGPTVVFWCSWRGECRGIAPDCSYVYLRETDPEHGLQLSFGSEGV